MYGMWIVFEERRTWRVVSLEDPEGVRGVGEWVAVPEDADVPRQFLELGRAWEGLHV